jgi:hypothetical protein
VFKWRQTLDLGNSPPANLPLSFDPDVTNNSEPTRNRSVSRHRYAVMIAPAFGNVGSALSSSLRE